MTQDRVTIGIAQWLAEPARGEENLARALGYIHELAGRGAELIVLPEMWPSGYRVATLPDVAASAEELVQAADKAMYAVKDSGKNGILAAVVPADN